MSKRNHALVASNSNVDLLSAWIEGQIAYSGLPGMSIGIVQDQTLLWARGFGYANVGGQIPSSPDTLYRIASITKLFTSTALLILRDAGKLQLDDSIQKHLPWFQIKNGDDRWKPITIRHLITHTSGLPRESAFPYWTDDIFPTIRQVKEALAGQDAVYPPEHLWKYSNLALTLAGEVVAAVSGRDYADFIQEFILDPLEMTSTLVLSPDPEDPKLAVGYGRRLPDKSRGVCPFTDSKGITPAANVTTSVNDLARFCMLQFRDLPQGGEQILSGRTLREMQRVHWLDPNWEAGWGLGFRILRKKGKTYVGHAGSVRGYRSQVQICPEDRIAVIVLINA
ncbi:MAG: beta-lactamase family protein, partial [Anaerolineales bacterium]|nr:beta-lactamase family protein [Anaerolineales bacterium]